MKHQVEPLTLVLHPSGLAGIGHVATSAGQTADHSTTLN